MSSMFPDDPDSNMDKIQDENALVTGNGNPPSSDRDNRMMIDSPPENYEEYDREDEDDIPDYYDDYDDDDDDDDSDDWDDEEYEDDQEMEDLEGNTSSLSEDEELTTKHRRGHE